MPHHPNCTSCSVLQQMEVYRARLRRQLLIDLYNGEPLHAGTLDEVGDYYGYDFAGSTLNLLVLDLVARSADGDSSRRKAALLRVEELLRTHLLPQFPEGELCATMDFVLCLLVLPDAAEAFPWKRHIRRSFDLLCQDPMLGLHSLILGEGVPCQDPGQLHACFRGAVEAIQHGIIGGYNRIYDSSSLPGPSKQAVALSPSQLSVLQAGLVSRDPGLLGDWVRELFAALQPQFEASPPLAFQLPREIMQSAHTLARSLPGEDLLLHAGDRLALCVTLEQEQAVLIDTFRQFCAAGTPNVSPGVARVQAHLARNYRSPLSLEELGRLANLNPQYLSVLFRQETGQTISQSIRALRLSAAQELLKDPSLSIAQVASAVGYSDSRYFSRVFQRALGQSPSTYRGTHGASPAGPAE